MFRLFCSAVKAKLPNKQHFYQHAAVATDNAECSKIGRNILKKGGSAVDSAIAAILCVGVINLHSTGIGGGGFMMVYDSHKRSAEMIDFRETAPQRAGVDLFKGDPMNGILGKIKYVCRRNCMYVIEVYSTGNGTLVGWWGSTKVSNDQSKWLTKQSKRRKRCGNFNFRTCDEVGKRFGLEIHETASHTRFTSIVCR